jgi:hypothetical protein
MADDEEAKRRRCGDCGRPLHGLEQRDFAKEVAAANRPKIFTVSRDRRLAVDDYEELVPSGTLPAEDGAGWHLKVVTEPCDVRELPT